MNDGYEKRRKEGMISYFLPKSGVQVTGEEFKPLNEEYTLLVDCSYAVTLLKKRIQYERSWTPYKVNRYSAMWDYIVNQCEAGGYRKCLLSTKEFNMLNNSKK